MTSASPAAAGIPTRHSIVSSVWKRLRSLEEHPNPRMAAARIRADERSRKNYVGTAASAVRGAQLRNRGQLGAKGFLKDFFQSHGYSVGELTNLRRTGLSNTYATFASRFSDD